MEKFKKFKATKFFKYKYSPDNVVFQIKKVKGRTANSITLEVAWLGEGIIQDVVITADNIDSYEETV